MVDDTTKKGILDWLFGKGALDKAAGTGGSESPIQKEINKGPKYVDQDTSYIRKQIEATERKRKEDYKLIKPLPNAVPSGKPDRELITPIPNAKPSDASKDALKKLVRGNNNY